MIIQNKHLPLKNIKNQTLYKNNRKARIDTLVIHYISAVNVDKYKPFSLDTIVDIFENYRCSAHYVIDREGYVYRLVHDSCVAYHAGVSSLNGRSIGNSVNDFSIGIELVGGSWIDFTEHQYKSLAELTYDLQKKYIIPKENIVGHSNVAPKRKVDPGKRFNWKKYFVLIDEIREKNKIKIEEEKKMVNNISTGYVSFYERFINTFKHTFKKYLRKNK